MRGLERRHPFRPERTWRVGHRVLADRVDARDLDPPETVLDQVVRDVRIILIQVGQHAREPAIERLAHGLRVERRVCDGVDAEWIVGVILDCAVEPRRLRRVRDPRVFRPDVIGNLVLDDLDAHPMGFVDEGAELVHRSEPLLDVVVVRRVVAVVVLRSVVVVIDRRHPDRRDAKVLQIGQTLPDSGDVPSVVGARIRPIHAGRVVRPAAVGKPVRHDEVDDVVRREPGEASGWVRPLQESERYGRPGLPGLNVKSNGTRFRIASDSGICDQRRPGGVRRLSDDLDSRRGRNEFCRLQSPSTDEQLHFRPGVTDPPRRRIAFRNNRRWSLGRDGRNCDDGGADRQQQCEEEGGPNRVSSHWSPLRRFHRATLRPEPTRHRPRRTPSSRSARSA